MKLAFPVILLLCTAAMAETKPVDFTAPVLIDGKTIPNPKTHDPADYVTFKEGPRAGEVADTDPRCGNCMPMTLGDAVTIALENVTDDEARTRKPTIPTRESWVALAAKLKGDSAAILSSRQKTLIEDRIDAIFGNATLALRVKMMIDPDYSPTLPE